MTNNNPHQGPFQKKKNVWWCYFAHSNFKRSFIASHGKEGNVFLWVFFFFIRTHQWNIWAFFFFLVTELFIPSYVWKIVKGSHCLLLGKGRLKHTDYSLWVPVPQRRCGARRLNLRGSVGRIYLHPWLTRSASSDFCWVRPLLTFSDTACVEIVPPVISRQKSTPLREPSRTLQGNKSSGLWH